MNSGTSHGLFHDLRVKFSEPKPSKGNRVIRVAVAGNPNTGKSTLINAIAGTRLQVGNWPGVTVEKKEAELEHSGQQIKFVDLPGTYSLSPYSTEEIIARDYLVKQRPDLIINVVDATNLERNIYLTVQLLELGIPVVLALNMFDEARGKGFQFDLEKIERMLGVTVVTTVATKGQGVDRLLDTLLQVTLSARPHRPKRLNYGDDIEAAIAQVSKLLSAQHPMLEKRYPLRWLACKLIENDRDVVSETNLGTFKPSSAALKHLSSAHDEDIEGLLADARYALAKGFTREVVQKPTIRKMEVTEKIDRVILNRFLGIPIFLFTMWLVFKLTFDISAPFGDWLDGLISGPGGRLVRGALTAVDAPAWTISLALEGVLSGVGFVLVFVPVIFVMLFFITFLEASGYMARVAFVMDRAMHSVGLHGKSFIPMLLGFGCNVPGIYATRALENQRDKILTSLLIPLMSCGARLPVYVMFAGVFFAAHAGTVIWLLYVLGILLAITMGLVFRRTLFRGENPVFIMELPPYRLPSLKCLSIHTWEKGKHFLFKAGTYILAVSIFVWFLLNLPWGVESKKDSYLGLAGQTLAPIFAPVGFDTWEATSSLITGVIAKEIVVGTMGEIYTPRHEVEKTEDVPTVTEELFAISRSFLGAAGESLSNVVTTFGISSLAIEEVESESPLKNAVRDAFTPLTACSFMVFVLLYMPCVVVAIAMRQEFGTWKWPALSFAYQTVLAWGVAFIVFQGGTLLGLGG